MNVLIIGSGGREHALCVSCKKSTDVNQIFVCQEMLVLTKYLKMF